MLGRSRDGGCGTSTNDGTDGDVVKYIIHCTRTWPVVEGLNRHFKYHSGSEHQKFQNAKGVHEKLKHISMDQILDGTPFHMSTSKPRGHDECGFHPPLQSNVYPEYLINRLARLITLQRLPSGCRRSRVTATTSPSPFPVRG